jgi:hypothetical protein
MLIHRLKSESVPLPSFKTRIPTTKPNQLRAPNLTIPPTDFFLTPVVLSYRRNTDTPSGNGTGPTLQPTHQPHAPDPRASPKDLKNPRYPPKPKLPKAKPRDSPWNKAAAGPGRSEHRNVDTLLPLAR